jgi:hypothetical protein
MHGGGDPSRRRVAYDLSSANPQLRREVQTHLVAVVGFRIVTACPAARTVSSPSSRSEKLGLPCEQINVAHCICSTPIPRVQAEIEIGSDAFDGFLLECLAHQLHDKLLIQGHFLWTLKAKIDHRQSN